MKKLNIMVFTEEDKLYLPNSVDCFLSGIQHNVLGVYLLRNPTTASQADNFKTFKSAFGIAPMFSYLMRILPAVYEKLIKGDRASKYSVAGRVAKLGHKLKTVDNVNAKEFVDEVRAAAPDLIVTISPTQIMKKEILSIPKLGCINVHTSELPNHRGLYPVFWAMSVGDDQIGISVHEIDEGIDTGAVYYQSYYPLQDVSSMHQAITETKILGAKSLITVVDKLANGEKPLVDTKEDQAGSYNSFPTKEGYASLRRNGYKLW